MGYKLEAINKKNKANKQKLRCRQQYGGYQRVGVCEIVKDNGGEIVKDNGSQICSDRRRFDFEW